MACRPNTSLHLERVSAPISGMLLRPRCARCTSRWLVLRSRRFGPSCWTFRRDFQLNREVDPPGGLTNWARKRVPTSQARVLLYEALVNRCDLFCGKRGEVRVNERVSGCFAANPRSSVVAGAGFEPF